MAKKPTYKELEQEVKRLRKEAVKLERAGKVLEESEARLRYLLTTSPAVIYTCKPAGNYPATFINENIKAQLGYEPEEFVNKPKFWAEHIHPEDRPRVFAELPRVFEHGYYSHEYRFQKKDGTYRWMHDELRLLRDGQGNPIEIVGYWIDITRRKRAEESLKKRSHELDERIKELNCLYGISHLVEQDGISLEEILQATADLLPLAWQYPEITCARIAVRDQQFKTKNFRKTTWNQSGDIVVHSDQVGTVEVCCLEEKPDVDEGPFLKEERKLLDAVAKRVGKIIEREQAEEALRESEKKYRTLFEASIDGILITDIETRTFRHANPALCKLLGYSEEEIKSSKMSDVHPRSELDFVISEFEAHANGEKTSAENIPFVKKDGTIAYVDITGTPAFIDGKNCSIRFLRDVTQRKRSEEELRIKDNAIASSINAIAFSDLEGKLIYVNNAFLQLWGYKEKEVLGKPTVRLWKSRRKAAEVIDALRGRRNWTGELTAKRKNGSLFHAQLSASMVRGEDGKPICMMASFVDITKRKQAEDAVRKREVELKAQSHHLNEVNAALKVLLKQREDDKKDVEENVLSNVKELVAPQLERLKRSRLNSNQKALVGTLESNLNNIVSPFVSKLSSKFLALTPMEIRVADVVKEGKTNKDIAEELLISKNTVLYHRYNIRTKLGLRNRKINLRSYLLSLAK